MTVLPGQPATTSTDYPGFRAAVAVAVVAWLFSALITGQLLGHHVAMNREDPLTTRELAELRQQLGDQPQDEALKAQIRAADLDARQDFFTRQGFLYRGGLLLIVTVTLGVAATRKAVDYRTRPYQPTGEPPDTKRQLHIARLAQAAVLVLVAVTIAGGAWLATAGRPRIQRADLLALQQPDESEAAPETVDTIEPEQPQPAAGPPTLEEFTAHWPQFRGPFGSGVAGEGDYPETWDGATNTNIKWKTPIPLPGHNSIVAWGDRVFCTGANETKRQVYCLDADTGRTMWQRNVTDLPGSPFEPPQVWEETGYAAPTAATDGRRVYAIFANGDLVAYDFEGQRIWDLALGNPDNAYGHSTSLAVHRDLLLVQFDQGYPDEPGSSVMAFDTATGKLQWETPRETAGSWISPIVVQAADRWQFVTVARPHVIAYDPATGEEWWRCGGIAGDAAPSPILGDDLVIAISPMDRVFAVRADGSGDVTDTHVAWETTDMVPDIVSPLSDGERAYWVTTDGTITCGSLADGATLWQEEPDMSFRSSPSLVNGEVHLTSVKGVTVIFEPGDPYRELRRNELGEAVMSSPAFHRDRIYLRAEKNVYCIGADSE